MEAWQSDLVNGINSVKGVDNSAPSFPGAVFSVTSRGEVVVFDPKAALAEESASTAVKKMDGQFSQEISVRGHEPPVIRTLDNGFGAGSLLAMSLTIQGDRFSINLQIGRPAMDSDVALHFNPRIDDNKTILNSKQNGAWAVEEKQPLCIMKPDGDAFKAFNLGHTVQIVIKSEANFYQVIVNGIPYCRFHHRIKPEEVTHFRISGSVEPKGVTYHSKSLIIPPSQMYWRTLGGGHFLQVESTPAGVTWGLGYDGRPWVYTGATGGAHFKGSSGKFGINTMEDSKFFYVYENQRWNPLTGFTSTGLPTDRYSWSDRSGR